MTGFFTEMKTDPISRKACKSPTHNSTGRVSLSICGEHSLKRVTGEAQGLHPAQASDDCLPGRTYLNGSFQRSTLREGTRRQDQEEERGHFSCTDSCGKLA